MLKHHSYSKLVHSKGQVYPQNICKSTLTYESLDKKKKKPTTSMISTSGNSCHIRQVTFQQHKNSSASHLGLGGIFWSVAKYLCYHRLLLQPLHHCQVLTAQQHEHIYSSFPQKNLKLSGHNQNFRCLFVSRETVKLW